MAGGTGQRRPIKYPRPQPIAPATRSEARCVPAKTVDVFRYAGGFDFEFVHDALLGFDVLARDVDRNV